MNLFSKIVLLLLFFLIATTVSGQKRINLTFARSYGITNVSYLYNGSTKYYYKGGGLVPKKNRIDLQVSLFDRLDFKVGYSNFSDLQDGYSGVFYHQIPLVFVFKNKIIKGLNIGIEGGMVNNLLASNHRYDKNEYLFEERLIGIDSITRFVRKTYINVRKKNTILPIVGLQLQYQFNNGIELNYSISFMYGGRSYIRKTEIEYENSNEATTYYHTNHEFWRRFSLSIPIYNFDRNRKEKTID